MHHAVMGADLSHYGALIKDSWQSVGEARRNYRMSTSVGVVGMLDYVYHHRPPQTITDHHRLHCSHVVSALVWKYESLLYIQLCSFADTSLNVEHLEVDAS